MKKLIKILLTICIMSYSTSYATDLSLVSIDITQVGATLTPNNRDTKLKAIGTDIKNNKIDVTDLVYWGSTNIKVFRVNPTGLMHVTGEGTSYVTAVLNGVSSNRLYFTYSSSTLVATVESSFATYPLNSCLNMIYGSTCTMRIDYNISAGESPNLAISENPPTFYTYIRFQNSRDDWWSCASLMKADSTGSCWIKLLYNPVADAESSSSFDISFKLYRRDYHIIETSSNSILFSGTK